MTETALTSDRGVAVRTSFAVGGGPTAATDARASIRPLRSQVGDELAGQLALVLSELVTNSYRHAGAGDAEISVDVAVTRERVRCEVTDLGEGFRPEPVPECERGEGGWGLHIVDTLADRWGVYSGPPTRVWVELSR